MMKLTKDEARILADILNEAKYNFNNQYKYTGLYDALDNLQARLNVKGRDKRRAGRTSQNDFNDCVKRFILTTLNKYGPNNTINKWSSPIEDFANGIGKSSFTPEESARFINILIK